ncbi:YxeA family protein [Mammaliicoccus lentus]|uniref:YxeA family protein n=1 Tax=Mammaliicoccus lentus TaxID=42858 RepID=UPI002DBC1483|nr:YxeA family protein [Mammaliicoccus lentus]MEB8091940.1 YxeA family protein [Mammaliicoccus lentus]
MRKIIGIIVIVPIILVALFMYFFVSDNGYYKTEDYYVLINSNPKIGYEQDDTGNKIKTYTYKVTGYNDGDSRQLDLQLRNKLSKKSSYLIKWEDRRGIVSDIKQISLQKFKENK